MSTMIVLFNLKPGVAVADYEAWAKSTDLPIVRGLKSIDAFDVYRVAGLLGSEDTPPYAYVELIQIGDLDAFGPDVGSETMQKVAGEFQARADNPVFMLANSIEKPLA